MSTPGHFILSPRRLEGTSKIPEHCTQLGALVEAGTAADGTERVASGHLSQVMLQLVDGGAEGVALCCELVFLGFERAVFFLDDLEKRSDVSCHSWRGGRPGFGNFTFALGLQVLDRDDEDGLLLGVLLDQVAQEGVVGFRGGVGALDAFELVEDRGGWWRFGSGGSWAGSGVCLVVDVGGHASQRGG